MIKTFLSSMILIFALAGAILAQENAAPSEWVKLVSNKKDLSFLMPSGFLVNKTDDQYSIYGAKGEVSLSVTLTSTGIAKRTLNLWRSGDLSDEASSEDFTLGDFTGRVISYDRDKSFRKTIQAASSQNLYTISASAKTGGDKVLLKFLRSILLNGQPLFTAKDTVPEEKTDTIAVADLKVSPIILEYLKKPENKSLKLERAKAKEDAPEENDKVSITHSRSIIILRKPRPAYTETARSHGAGGTVRLKLTFLANGTIGRIVLVSSPGYDLDKAAFRAAKTIKFLPAEVDGKPVDVTKVVEYNFKLY